MPTSNRPQTLKQAKKAYRKSGAQVRLSESELAIIERRAVLQERADRIKEREARRKENIKRKEERNQREREARQRMGIPSPAKEGIHVGPSQLGLAAFMAVKPAGGKRKRGDGSQRELQEERGSQAAKEEDSMRTCADVTGMQQSSISRSPRRNPLQPIAVNANLIRRLSPKDGKGGTPAVEGLSHRENNDASRQPSPSSAQGVSAKPDAQLVPRGGSQKSDMTKEEASTANKCQIKPMGPPPPPRRSFHTQSTTTASQPKAPAMPPQDRAPDTQDEGWDDFFASSTQIARELSPSTTIKAKPKASTSARTLPPPPPPPPLPPPSIQSLPPLQPLPLLQPLARLPTLPKDDAVDFLYLISTQDLDFSPDPSQSPPHILTDESTETDSLLAHLSTQDLNFSMELTQAVPLPQENTSDFDEDLTEEDLEDIVLEFEFESGGNSRTTSPILGRTKERSESMGEEEKQPPNDKSPFLEKRHSSEPETVPNDTKQPATHDPSNRFSDSSPPSEPFEIYLPNEPHKRHFHMIDHSTAHATQASKEIVEDEWGEPPGWGRDTERILTGIFKGETKTEIKPNSQPLRAPLPQFPYQDAQLLDDDDGFDLSTQDLRELGC